MATASIAPNAKPAAVATVETKTRTVRRVASAAGRAALSEKHTLAALGTAGALGLARRTGFNVPHITVLGQEGTVGVALWVAGKVTKNATLQHMATGALSIALYNFAKGGAAGVAGDDLAGDETLSGEI